MASPSTLSKKQIAALYQTDLRTIHRALAGKENEFHYWFSRTKTFLPSQYKPILNYLEKDCGLEKSPNWPGQGMDKN